MAAGHTKSFGMAVFGKDEQVVDFENLKRKHSFLETESFPKLIVSVL